MRFDVSEYKVRTCLDSTDLYDNPWKATMRPTCVHEPIGHVRVSGYESLGRQQ